MDARWVTLTAVAKRLGISRVTALKKLRAGVVPGRQVVAGIQRIHRKIFESWADAQELGKTE